MNLLRLTRHLIPALLVFTLVGTSKLQAQTAERPQRGPEHQKLQAWVGEWKYEGTLQETPLGPGGKFAGRDKEQWVMNGLFLESRAKDTGVYNGKKMTYEGLVVRWHDPNSQTFRSRSFDTDGIVGEGEDSVSGNTWTSKGWNIDSKGKKNLSRETSVLSADGKTRKAKMEISLDDGKTWMLLWELTAKKR